MSSLSKKPQQHSVVGLVYSFTNTVATMTILLNLILSLTQRFPSLTE